MTASMNLEKVEQCEDIFLHGDLYEKIHMKQTEGFRVESKEDILCKLKKSLFRLKQPPLQWYTKFNSFMIGHGHKKMNVDYCVYIRRFSNDF